jgi:hypothetical protein
VTRTRLSRRRPVGPCFCHWASERAPLVLLEEWNSLRVRVPTPRSSLVKRKMGEFPARTKIVNLESAIRDDNMDGWVGFWLVFLVEA